MTISDHLQELHGLPVFDFPGADAKAASCRTRRPWPGG